MAVKPNRFEKQPGEIIDYNIDFSEWFSTRSDGPALHVVFNDPGIVLVGQTRADTVVQVVLSGGADGTTYKVTVRMTTTSGIVKEADIFIRVREV